MNPSTKAETNEIQTFVAAIEAKLDLPERSGLGDEDRPERFWLASNGHRGRIAKLIYRAAEEAYQKARPRLDDALFADVLRRRYNVIDDVNPFLITELDNAIPISDDAWEDEDEDEDDETRRRNLADRQWARPEMMATDPSGRTSKRGRNGFRRPRAARGRAVVNRTRKRFRPVGFHP